MALWPNNHSYIISIVLDMIHYPTSGTRPHPSANQGTVSQFAWPVLKEPLTKDCLNRPQVGRQLCRGIGGKYAGGGVVCHSLGHYMYVSERGPSTSRKARGEQCST